VVGIDKKEVDHWWALGAGVGREKQQPKIRSQKKESDTKNQVSWKGRSEQQFMMRKLRKKKTKGTWSARTKSKNHDFCTATPLG
jgi:hypothetical protein